MTLRKAIILAAVLVCPALSVGQSVVHLAGDDKIVWRTVGEESGQQLLIYSRDKNEWKQVAEVDGEVSRVCVLNRRLHVFYQGGPHQYFDVELDGPRTGSWSNEWNDRELLAAAAGPGVLSGEATYYLMVELFEPLPPPRPQEPPSSADEGKFSGRRNVGVIYCYVDQQWQRVAAVPDVAAKCRRFSMVATTEGLVVVGTDRDGRVAWAGRYSGETVGQWEELPTPAWPDEETQTLALVHARDVLVLAGSLASGENKTVLLRRIGAEDPAEPVVLEHEGKRLEIPAGSAISVARYGNGMALAWTQDKQWQFAVCGELDGQVNSVAALEGPVDSDDLERFQTIYSYVVFALVLCMMVLWFRRRKACMARPFMLPMTMRPGSWLKRIVAFFIDQLPFSLLGFAVTGKAHLLFAERSPGSIEEMFKTGKGLEQYWLPGVVALGMYLVYCILMEKAFGRTLGKLVFGLRVVGSEGKPPGWSEAVIRNITKIVELSSTYLVVLFAIWPMLTPFRQRLGDLVARTVVVDRRPAAQRMFIESQLGASPPPPPSQNQSGQPEEPEDDEQK